MSGGVVNYTLRPNKYVDRKLFIELIRLSNPDFKPADYVYISLGGPQLEDHLLIHCQLGITNLVSLDNDECVISRQIFNNRRVPVDCRNTSTTEFIRDFDQFVNESFSENDKKFIVWLDYTSPRERLEQLNDITTLIGDFTEGDILKVTMNANSKTLGGYDNGLTQDELFESRRKNLREQLGNFFPSDIPQKINQTTFPLILTKAIKLSAVAGLKTKTNLETLPIGIFVYQDGYHQMLTLTLIIIKSQDRDVVSSQIIDRGWEFLPADWNDITKINVPQLTLKERLCIEGLAADPKVSDIYSSLPFLLSKDENITHDLIDHYLEHCCRYPSFHTVNY